MYLLIVVGMFVFVILLMSVCVFTVSNALLKSSAMSIVRCGGALLLNPLIAGVMMLCSAVVVECCLRNPCWNVGSVMLSVMYGNMIFSMIFAIGEMSAIGLYPVPVFVFLPGFGMGMIFACFHMRGMMLLLSAWL